MWSLRAGYSALALTFAGLILTASGSTLWVLAAGVVLWLGAAAVTLTAFFRARHDLPRPRPGLWAMRLMLICDSVHALPPGDRV